MGDAMLDVYHFGTATRLSPEAPIPVVKIDHVSTFPGGAANVERNLQALQADVKLLRGRTGNPADVPVKNRLMVDTIQVARWDEYDKVASIELERIDQAVLHWAPDALIVSDYGKGSITYEVLEVLAALGVPTFIDSKRSPKDFEIFDTPTFFPNQKEFDEHLAAYMAQSNVILKRGAHGIQRLKYGQVTEEYPAWARQVVSVAGAGDSVIAAFVYAICVGYNPLPFASGAAAVVVEQPWTSVATMDQICELLKTRSST